MGDEDSKTTISTLGDRLVTLFTEIRNTAGGRDLREREEDSSILHRLSRGTSEPAGRDDRLREHV